MEKWHDIEDFEGLYQVSSYGRIKRIEHWKLQETNRTNKHTEYRQLKEKILSTNGKDRYASVTLCKGKIRKSVLVHRLVAKAFLPNLQNLPEINHKDCNTRNNHVDNLEWCDRKYNINYADRTKKAMEKIQKKVQCIESGVIYDSVTKASLETNLQKSKISLVCNGKRKTTGGLHWQFI